MNAIFGAMHRTVEHPGTNLTIALLLVVSAVSEVTGLYEELQSHHGVLVYGIAQGLKALPELFEGLRKIIHGHETDEPEA